MSRHSATGKLTGMSCRKALLKLARQGHFTLPAPRRRITFRATSCECVQLKLTSAMQITWIKRIEVVAVRGKELSAQRNKLVADHHDLGYRPLAGAQLRYLIPTKYGFVAALAFRSAASRSWARDRWIGWRNHARQAYLDRVVCNARFAIVSTLRVKNFASRVLARVLRRLPALRLDGPQRVLQPVPRQNSIPAAFGSISPIVAVVQAAESRERSNHRPWLRATRAVSPTPSAASPSSACATSRSPSPAIG